MAFVIKVEFDNILRRLTYGSQGKENLSFADLEEKIRDLFELLSSDQLKITYKDKEDDDVTLANDEDLNDACFIQKLNPLRIHVVVLPDKTRGNDVATSEAAQDESQSVGKIMIPEADLKKIVEGYAPVFEGICPPNQVPQVVDDIVKKVTAQVSAITVARSSQTNESVNLTPETRQLTPLDWLNSLPTSCVSAQLDKVNKSPVVHKGVTCDMCHMNPVTGIRYKAIKKINYDLCGPCFDRSGRADEYTRIEQPLSLPAWGINSTQMGSTRVEKCSG